MTLQLQLNLEQADESSDDVFTCRLSRVVTKLFARVIKAEEATKASYAQERVDMEVLICSMEDLLSACQHAKHEGKSGSVEVCSDMVKSLVLSIICAHGDATSLRQQMNELGIHSDGSELGVLVSACAEEISSSRKAHVDTEAIIQADAIENPSSDPFNCPQPKTPSKDVASLVSRLGRAPPGAEREAALEEIRNYKATYGEAELDAHLQQLSGAFRDFIEEQIKGDPTPLKEKAAYVGTSVSDRIRSLRSRLQATDLSVQTAVEEGALEPAASPPCPMLAPQPVGPPNTVAQTASTSNFMAPSWTELTEQIAEEVQAPEPAANSQQPTLAPILSDRPKAAIATVTSSNLVEPSQSLKFAVCTAMGKDALEPAASPFQPTLASKPSGTAKIVAVPSSHRLAPSPSKLLQPSPSKFSSMSESRLQPPGQSRLLTVSTSSSAQTLRERLAARHELREAAETIASATTKVESPTNSFGRAAALRARLEAVKQQSKLQK